MMSMSCIDKGMSAVDIDLQNGVNNSRSKDNFASDFGADAAVYIDSEVMRILKLAASAEQSSQHPLATAILDAARERDISLYPLQEGRFSILDGKGIQMSTPEGYILIGNRLLMNENKVDVSKWIDDEMWKLESQGKTVVCISLDYVIIGILAVSDVTKTEAVQTISALRSMNIDVWMMTGDNITTAEAVADELDIPKVNFQLMHLFINYI
jgi:Cu+-exporting ATPase